MKTSAKILLMGVLTMTAQRCMEDDLHNRTQLQFTFSFTGSSINVSGQSLVVTVADSEGNTPLFNEVVTFRAEGDGYITTPVSLPGGTYEVVNFAIIDDADQMVFAAPASTSLAAQEINHPVGREFLVVPDQRVTLPVSLLPVANRNPQDFGYHAFRVSKQTLKVIVFADGESGPVTAHARLLDNEGNTVATYELRAAMNHIPVFGNDGARYTLVVSRAGFSTFQYDLKSGHLPNRPIKIHLDVMAAAFTMLVYVEAGTSRQFNFSIVGPGGTINLDWGDGTDTTFTMGGEWGELIHAYASDGNYPVTLTGDIAEIRQFYSAYGQGMIDEINFEHLTSLVEVRFALTRSPSTIDLSHNTNLNFVMLAGLPALETVLLPEHHDIAVMDITGPNNMQTAAVDAVVDNIYSNAVAKGIVNGNFGIAREWFHEEGDYSMAGPPSGASVSKLKTLRSAYGWYLLPEIPE